MHYISDLQLQRLIEEDLPSGDLTTQTLGIGTAAARMEFFARGDMTVATIEEAARILEMLGVRARAACCSGAQVSAGTRLLSATGPASAIFAGWKVAQNLVEWASGIASEARSIVDAAHAVDRSVVVACTRKAPPGTRILAQKSVVAGGASIHRIGLSDTVLLFPEHRQFGGNEALRDQLARLRMSCPERKLVVEVKNIGEALIAARNGADVLQLEKFSPSGVTDTIAMLRELGHAGPLIAVAGGINARNVADYIRAGARIVVTSSPYTARPADVQVVIDAVPER